MAIADNLLAGVELMLLGMGIVFTFLLILVVAMKLMSMFAQRWSESDSDIVAATNTPLIPTAGPANDTAIVAAISAAISRYRTANRG